MIKKYELNSGIVKIYENYVVTELKEGILFDVNCNRRLLSIGLEEFQGKPYGYISNRIHSYAVDPMVYREAADHSPLKAIAVVTNTELGWKSAELERSFYKNKSRFEIFTSYDDALIWMNNILPD